MQNYFDVFKLKTNYSIDLNLLENNYQSLMQKLHPDNFSAMADMAKRIANQKSSELNHAYTTLLSPISRAKHLLELNSYTIDFESERVGPEYIMHQFELREEFAELEEKNSDDAYNVFLSNLENEYNALLNSLVSLFVNKEHSKVKDLLLHLKFLERLIEKVKHNTSIYVKELSL